MTKIINLSNLHETTAQEVFDQVAKHLLKQGKSSIGDTGCLYRSSDGLKCAAGCLIADDEYNPIIDNRQEFNSVTGKTCTGWGCLVDSGIVRTGKHQELIKNLQYIHDSTHEDRWQERLHNLAGEEKLKFKLEEYLA